MFNFSCEVTTPEGSKQFEYSTTPSVETDAQISNNDVLPGMVCTTKTATKFRSASQPNISLPSSAEKQKCKVKLFARSLTIPES